MKSRTAILTTILLGAFAITPAAFAWEKGGCDHGGSSGGGSIQGDNTRERADSVDRGSEELNHDNGLQGAEGASASGHGHGTSIGNMARGEPRDPSYSFNRTKEETMDHD